MRQIESWFRNLIRSGLSACLVLGMTTSAMGQEAAQAPAAQAAGEQPVDAQTEETLNKYPEIKDAVELLKAFKFQECLEKLEEAQKNHPELPPGRLVYAELLVKANQLPVARAEMEKVVTEVPEDPRAYLSMGAIGLAEGRLTDALLEINKALELAQSFDFVIEDNKTKFIAKCYLGRATIFERREDWGQVKEDLEKWLATDDKNGQIRQRLAQAHFFLGDVAKAEEELRQAKVDTPNLSPAETALGSFFGRKDDKEKAEEYLRKGIESDPTNWIAYHSYAQWLFNQNRTREAKEQVNKGLETLPDSKDLRILRAVIARNLKEYEIAEVELEDLLKVEPNNMPLRNELALSLAEQQDSNKQKKAFEIAAQNFQAVRTSADYIATLGWVNYRLGRMDDAEKLISAAARQAGSGARPELLYYLAHVLAEKGKNEEVQKVLMQISQSKVPFPFRDDATQWLDRLQGSAQK